MRENAYNYSLCLGRKVNDRVMLCRIADYDPDSNMFTQATYTDKYNWDYKVFQPVLIGANPAEHFDLHKVYMRKWTPSENDPKKQYSYPYDNSAIEIVFNSELLECRSDNEALNILQRGIHLHAYLEDDFLLIIGKGTGSLRAIKCSKRDFDKTGNLYKIAQKVEDVLHTTHKFPVIEIKKGDYVSDINMCKQMSFDNEITYRYFYKSSVLPSAIEYFVPRSSKAYIKAYLKWYCKKERENKNLLKKTTDEFFTLLENAENSEEDLASFFKNTPFSIEEVKLQLEESSNIVKDYLSSEPEVDIALGQIIAKDPSLFERATKSIESDWLEKQTELKSRMANELESLEEEKDATLKEIEKIKLEKKQIVEEIKKNKKNLEELKIKAKKEEENSIKIAAATSKCIEDLRNNMIDTLKDVGLYEIMTKCSSMPYSETNTGYFKQQIKTESFDEIDRAESVTEFIEDFADNLSILLSDPNDIACSVISILSAGKGILLDNDICYHVALSYSLLIEKKPPEYICVVDPQVNVNGLINEVLTCDTKTVVITGLFDSYNEIAINALCQVCNEKNLFFAVSGKEITRLLSKTIYNQVLYLNLEDCLRINRKNEKLIASNNSLTDLVVYPDEKSISTSYDTHVQQLVRDDKISHSFACTMAKIIALYISVDSSKQIGKIIQKIIDSACTGNAEKDE